MSLEISGPFHGQTGNQGLGVNLRDQYGNYYGTELFPLAVNVVESISPGDPVVTGALIKKSFEWTGVQTEQVVWTPASGKKFVICDIFASVVAACTVELHDGATGLSNRIFKANWAQYGGGVSNYRKPIESSAADNELLITCSANGGYITVSGYEI